MTLRGASREVVASAVGNAAARPVLLLTFDVPVLPEAAQLAVDTAVESGQPLMVVNAVELTIRPMTASWGHEVIVAEDVDESLRAPAELAGATRARCGHETDAGALLPQGRTQAARGGGMPRLDPAGVSC